MKALLPKSLYSLAECMHSPLYLVGGGVRDYLSGFEGGIADFDICSPAPESEVLRAAEQCGIEPNAVYPATGTIKLKDGSGNEFEFTRFRSDKYARGCHAPSEVAFTTDIKEDALRRDFCANAVYYNLRDDRFEDPLDGIKDIKERKLRAVKEADKVFSEDGLRLMRLARIAAQIGFTPDEESVAAARAHAKLILDIAPERVFKELDLILFSDEKHSFSNAPYRGLKLLAETGVLEKILPELASGANLTQNSAFHNYDVLEHSLRCVLYAPKEIRYAALLHDVGKPFCYFRDGNFYEHAKEGERLTREILSRLKAPKKLIQTTARLVALHMRDYNLQMRESKIRREIVENYDILPKLFLIKQADFSACKDNLSAAPVVTKWKAILKKMQDEGVPFTVRQLAVSGLELQQNGVKPQNTGAVLRELLLFTSQNGAYNQKQILLAHAKYAQSNT